MNKIFLWENDCFKNENVSSQNHLEQSLKRIPGAKLVVFPGWKDFFLENKSPAVIAIPARLPQDTKTIETTLSEIKRHLPSPFFFAIQFVFYPDSKSFNPDTLHESSWVDLLDKYYDQAVPTNFVFFSKESAPVQSFQLAASVSGLLRDLDTLKELDRLWDEIHSLEDKFNELEGTAERRVQKRSQ